VRPGRQAVTATTDDAPIPVSLVQYLWAQWCQVPPEDREWVARLVGTLMQSPRWHWDVTVLPDQSLPDPQGPFVLECDGRPTIEMPIAMLREIWKQVVADVTMPPIMQRFVSITDPALWHEFWEELLRNRARRPKKRCLQHHLYGYLSPRRLPKIAHEIRRLLQSNAPNNQYTALTVLTRWLESPDHETRTIAAQMLHESTHVVAALVRLHPSDDAIRTMLDRLVPTILTAIRPEDRTAWVTTLWEVVTDPTLNEQRRYMSADALKRMLIHDPMMAALVHARLRTVPLTHPAFFAPVWNSLLEGLMHTAVAGEVLEEILDAIAQEIRQDRNAIARFAPIVAPGWGHGYDHRILQIITSNPSPQWEAVLARGITTSSMGVEVCAIIQSQVPRDQAMALIVNHIRAREERGDWPLAPLPAHLIPWVGAAARNRPYDLRPPTIRRLWLADPNQAWNVTQTMLHSDDLYVQWCAIAAMDAGWGRGHDDTIAATLRKFILRSQSSPAVAEAGTTTAVAGIGTAPPSLIAALLTELAMQGNETVQRQLISALHRGWGHGQDDLVMRVVETMDERGVSEQIWADAHETLRRAWDYLPPHVVVSLVDRLVTRATNQLAQDAPPLDAWQVRRIIAAFAPIWTHLPTAQVIARIAHHVAHLHAHAHTIYPGRRDELVAAWAHVIAAGAERLSASAIHAVLASLWTLSPKGCLEGVAW
jgi:hypothetical protein